MRASGLCKLAVAAIVTAAPAAAQDHPDMQTLRKGLTEILSLVTLGSIAVPEQAAEVKQSGNEVRVRLPLTGFVAPAGAAAEAIAQPDGTGGWDVTSMTFPSAGAIGGSIDQVVSYSIHEQAIHGRVDPTLASASALVADLRSITLKSVGGASDSDQTIEHITINGRAMASVNGRLDLDSRGSAMNWRTAVHLPSGQDTRTLVRTIDGRLAISGLDRGQGGRLVAATRSFVAAAQSHGGPPEVLPGERDDLRCMLDATDGLLSRFDVNEILDSISLDLGGGKSGTLGHMQLTLSGEAREQQLQAGLDIEMDALTLANLSADSAAFVPHHLTAKAVMAGIPVASLTALLREALMPDPDQDSLQRQITALLGGQDARFAVENIAFDSGPVNVVASARLRAGADGEVGANIHIAATGVDAMLALAHRRPDLQQVMPMLFMAKGAGRAEGGSIIWDIALGGGEPMTVNGVPFGQPTEQTR